MEVKLPYACKTGVAQQYVDALNQQVADVKELSKEEQLKILPYFDFFNPDRHLELRERIH